MNKLLTNIQDDSLTNHRQFDRMIYFNAGSQHYGNFANYNLTKGTTQKMVEYFRYDRTWTYCAWQKGLIYFSTAGSDGSNTIAAVLTNNYCQIRQNALNKLKAQTFTTGNLANLFFAITNAGTGSATGCKVYAFATNLDNIITPFILDDTFSLPYSIYGTNTYGGLNRSADSGDIPNPQYINGGFADFRAWDKELTPAQIHQVYTGGWQQDVRNGDLIFRLPATLAGTHFDSNTPTGKCRVLDISGNANHIILENMGTTPNLVAF